MSLLRRTLLATPAAVALIATATTSALAEPARAAPARAPSNADRTLFTWNGTVDREVVLVVRGRSVETRGAGLDASYAPRLDVREALPRQEGQLGVQMQNGRGDVAVLQQPSARNDYTALVRVRDPRGGQDNYRLLVTWLSSGNAWDPRGDDRDRDDRDRDNRGRDRNDDWDRGRGNDRDRDDDWGRGRGRGNDGWDNRGRGNRDAGSLSWRGEVDDVVDIRIQGRRVEYITRSGKRLRDERLDVRGNGLPRRPVQLELNVSRGRGSVVVMQQPNPRNGYTTVIRVVDKRSGYGDYDFDLRWY